MTPRWQLVFFIASVFYATAFAAMAAAHVWLWNAQGAIAPYDFVAVHAAGKLALAGHAANAYDWPAHRIAETVSLGHGVTWKEYLGWHYPPPFLFAASALAMLPYIVAFLAWSAATLPLYMLAMQRIVARGWLAALAFPATFYNIGVGQNGFLTAALAGGSLALLEEQPILAGALLGLLTYKPQFGILFPFALAAGGYWRSFGAAAVTAVAMALASWLVFGSEAWIAFVHSVPVTVDAVFVRGLEGWSKLNSVYGICRWLGADASVAGAGQIALTAALAAGIIALWRSPTPFPRKASALATATLLATPYVYIYDFPILAVAVAFLYREQPFDRREMLLIAIACTCIAIFPFMHAATGFVATLAVATIVCVRTVERYRLTSKRPIALRGSPTARTSG